MTDPTPPKVHEPEESSKGGKEDHYAETLRTVAGMAQRTDFMDRLYCKTTLVAIERLCSETVASHKFPVSPEGVTLSAPAPASHGEREAFEAWWRGYYHRADISIQMKPFAWAVWQAALQSRATLPGTQDARAAALSDEQRMVLGEELWRAITEADLFKLHTTNAELWRLIGLKAETSMRRLTPEGSAAKEKTE